MTAKPKPPAIRCLTIAGGDLTSIQERRGTGTDIEWDGLAPADLEELVTLIASECGPPVAETDALFVAMRVLADRVVMMSPQDGPVRHEDHVFAFSRTIAELTDRTPELLRRIVPRARDLDGDALGFRVLEEFTEWMRRTWDPRRDELDGRAAGWRQLPPAIGETACRKYLATPWGRLIAIDESLRFASETRNSARLVRAMDGALPRVTRPFLREEELGAVVDAAVDERLRGAPAFVFIAEDQRSLRLDWRRLRELARKTLRLRSVAGSRDGVPVGRRLTRRSGRTVSLDTPSPHSGESVLADTLESAEVSMAAEIRTERAVRDALDRLREDDPVVHAVLRMKFEGRSLRETARVYGIGVGKLRSTKVLPRVARALRHLESMGLELPPPGAGSRASG